MIEVHFIYLLRGPPMGDPKPLDEYCTLLPFGEALQRIHAETDRGDLMSTWPSPEADNVCAIHGRYFEHGGLRSEANARYTSPLLREGPEQLALLLGLVWGSGFRVFGNWNIVPGAAAAALPFRHAILGRERKPKRGADAPGVRTATPKPSARGRGAPRSRNQVL